MSELYERYRRERKRLRDRVSRLRKKGFVVELPSLVLKDRITESDIEYISALYRKRKATRSIDDKTIEVSENFAPEEDSFEIPDTYSYMFDNFYENLRQYVSGEGAIYMIEWLNAAQGAYQKSTIGYAIDVVLQEFPYLTEFAIAYDLKVSTDFVKHLREFLDSIEDRTDIIDSDLYYDLLEFEKTQEQFVESDEYEQQKRAEENARRRAKRRRKGLT